MVDQIDVTFFFISLFTAQHVSNVSTAILRSLRLIVDLFHVLCCSGLMCVGVSLWFGLGGVVSGVVWCPGWCGIRMQAEALLQPASTPPQLNHTLTPTHIKPEQYNP